MTITSSLFDTSHWAMSTWTSQKTTYLREVLQIPKLSDQFSSVNRRHFFFTVRQVKKEYNVIKNKGGNYAALEESRKEVLEQIPQEPNTEEALAFYQSTYGYTEDLRVVIQDLRLRIKVTLGFL